MASPSYLYTLIATTPKYTADSVLFRDLQDLYNGTRQIVKFLAAELLGSVSIKPSGFADPKYFLADGTAFPTDAIDSIALWGALSPDLTALGGTGYAAFVRIYL